MLSSVVYGVAFRFHHLRFDSHVIIEGRDLYYIYYTYNSEELGGTVICAYYAENLEDGRVVVFNSNALEPDNATVSGIVQLMVDTFKIV